MAKNGKPNQVDSNVPPVNGGSGPLEDVIQKYESSQDLLSQKEYRLQNRIGDVSSKIESQQDVLDDPSQSVANRIRAAKDKATLEELQEKLENQFDTLERSRLRGQTIGLQRQIGTQMREQRSKERIGGMVNRPDVFSSAQGQIELPTQQLYESVARKKSQINQLGSKLEDVFTSLEGEPLDDDRLKQVRQIDQQIGQLEKEQAINTSAIRQQRSAKLDPQGRLSRAEETAARTGSFLETRDIISTAKQGGFGSLEEETQKLSKMFEKLHVGINNYQKSLDGTVEDQKKYSEALEEAMGNVERQQKVTDAVREHGGGAWYDKLGKIADVMGKAISTGKEVFVDQEIQKIQLQASYGNLVNQQYDRGRSAIRGDMSALLEETVGQNLIKAGADKMSGRAQALAYGSATMDAIKGIAMGAGGVALAGPWGALAGAGGILDAFSGFAAASEGIPGGQAGLAIENALRGFTKAQIKLPALATQAFYDEKMGAFTGLQGMGSALRTNLAMLTDANMIDKWSNLGLSREERLELIPQLVGAVGSQEDIDSAMTRTAEARRSRILSGNQFTGLTNQLSQVGLGTANLADTMRDAVAAGMDNSKNIAQMVGGIVQLSARGAAMGISGAGAADLMGTSVQHLVKAGVSKNIAAITAANSLANWNKNATDTSMTLGNIVEMQKISDILPETDAYTKTRILGMGINEQANLVKAAKIQQRGAKNQEEQKFVDQQLEHARETGLPDMVGADGQFKLNTIEAAVKANLVGTMINTVRGDFNYEDIADKIVSGRLDEIDPKVLKQFQSAFFLKGMRIGDWNLKGPKKGDFRKVNKAYKRGEGTGVYRFGTPEYDDAVWQDQIWGMDDVTQLFRREKIDATTQSAVYASGEQLTGGSLAGIVTSLEKIAGNISIEKMTEKFTEAAKNLSVPKGFTEGAETINGAADTFSKAVDAFTKKVEKTTGQKVDSLDQNNQHNPADTVLGMPFINDKN